MKRREFLAASCLAAAAPLQQMVTGADMPAAAKQYLELRNYELADAEHQKAFDEFLARAAIPAWNRLAIEPVGVFQMAENENPNLWVLLPHRSLESVSSAPGGMLADPQFLQDGSAALNDSKDNPVFKRYESSLLLAFDQCPKVEIPTKKDTRVFQLRIYESRNAVMAKRKIEMFNQGGEIALFRTTGLHPVFFGESLIGGKMPNLTYMLGFDGPEPQKAAWDTFINHPEWKKLSTDPYYQDTVSNITNLVLRPTAASQI